MTELDELREQIEQLQKKNDNLLRIMRERANADRKIRPKKTHPGFILLVSEQTFIPNKKGLKGWRTVIQSPYPAEMQLEDVQRKLDTGTREELERLHIEQSMLTNRKANFVSGYWEVTIYHQNPLIYPVDGGETPGEGV